MSDTALLEKQTASARDPAEGFPLQAGRFAEFARVALTPLIADGRLAWLGAVIRRRHADSPLHIHDVLMRLVNKHSAANVAAEHGAPVASLPPILADAGDMIAALTLRAYMQAELLDAQFAEIAAMKKAAIAGGAARADRSAEHRQLLDALRVLAAGERDRAIQAEQIGDSVRVVIHQGLAGCIESLIDPQRTFEGEPS